MAGQARDNELDAAERNSMPDDEYAFPRERKEPLNDASHVRNAIARFDQVQDVTDDERDAAFRRIERAARKYGVEMTASSWRELGKPSGSSSGRGPANRSARSSSRRGGPSRDELYADAKRRNIKGRSSMTKEQLQRALRG